MCFEERRVLDLSLNMVQYHPGSRLAVEVVLALLD